MNEPTQEANVWLVFTESGQYEQYSRDLEAVFASEELANDFARVVSGEVEAHVVMTSAPVRATNYTWGDVVMLDGTISPDREFPSGVSKRFGQHRSAYPTWVHQSVPVTSRTEPWGGEREPEGPVFVEVNGRDREAVKAEYKRLVAEIRERFKHRSQS